MTTVQKKDLVKKALRNVRKAHRSLQTEAEALERRLDSLIKRKTLVTREQLSPIITHQNNLLSKYRGLEGQITTMLEISSI